MQNNISSIVTSQIPEHLVDSSPLFVEFVKTYYQYAEQKKNAVDLIQNKNVYFDIDYSDESYISKFYATYGEYLPQTIALDKRNFIKLLNSVYEMKGTENALKLIFRAVFNEYIIVSYPGEQVLKASGGTWIQSSFITLRKIQGTLPAIGNVIIVGQQRFSITEIDSIDSITVRLYFKAYSKIQLVSGQKITIVDINGVTVYTGSIIGSPSKLTISGGGKAWQRGQVVVIPGTTKNTIARILDIDVTGAVTDVEILEYGFSHDENQTTLISPYPNKPVGSIVNFSSVDMGGYFHHYLNISDYTDGTTERIIGQELGLNTNSYFLTDYVDLDYVANTVISVSTKSSVSISTNVNSNITIEDWLESRATFVYEFSNLVKTKGYFKNDEGQLSNTSIKLQDNYFYQAFSYLIESSRDIREYKNVLSITHPAGTKQFSLLAKTAQLEFDYSTTRTISINTAYLRSTLNISDSYTEKYFTKNLIDTVIGSSVITSKSFTKVLVDSVSVNSGILSKIFGKNITDPIVTADSIQQKLVGKVLADAIISVSNASKSISTIKSSAVVADDSTKSLSTNKYIIGDTIVAGHGDTVEFNTVGYDIEYFSENYSVVDKYLTI